MSMQSFLYEILNTNLIQEIQCKYLLKSISEMQVRMQLYNCFENEIKVIKILSLCSKHQPQAKQDTETKKTNALMEKQKRR